MIRYWRAYTALCLMMTLTPLGCKSDDAAQTQEEAEDPLADLERFDDRPDTKGLSTEETSQESLIPVADGEASISIDGAASGWDLGRDARVFDEKRHVVDGARFWTGREDAGLRVAVKADASYVYFWLEVSDDVVLNKEDASGYPVDGIILWLRDPKLEALAERLPEGVDAEDTLVTDLGLLFRPDGRVQRVDRYGNELYARAVRSVHFETERGWGVEAAIATEVLPTMYSLPMTEVAFRVEQIDGDEPDRLGVQTRMSAIPPSQKGPRYAVYSTGGISPHLPVQGPTSRADALGYFTRDEDHWRYKAIEVVPRYWSYMEERTEAFAQNIAEAGTLDTLCPPARFDQHILSAMESRSGKNRAALMMCAGRTVDGACDGSATSKLYWVRMTPDVDAWRLATSVEITPKALPQCLDAPAKTSAPLFTDFSMLPLDFIDPYTWAIGWRRVTRGDRFDEEIWGAWMIHTKKEQGIIGEVRHFARTDDLDERSLMEAQVYFAEVDEVKGKDICAIHKVDEQYCDRFQTGCATRQRGRTTLLDIDMWQPRKKTFEGYMLSKHRGCRFDFNFAEREGFLLWHTGRRLGLIPSVANTKDGEDGW